MSSPTSLRPLCHQRNQKASFTSVLPNWKRNRQINWESDRKITTSLIRKKDRHLIGCFPHVMFTYIKD